MRWNVGSDHLARIHLSEGAFLPDADAIHGFGARLARDQLAELIVERRRRLELVLQLLECIGVTLARHSLLEARNVLGHASHPLAKMLLAPYVIIKGEIWEK